MCEQRKHGSVGAGTGNCPGYPTGARGVVQEHWAKIGSGDYAGAYALLTSSVGGSQSAWISSHQQEHPQVLAADFGTPTFRDRGERSDHHAENLSVRRMQVMVWQL